MQNPNITLAASAANTDKGLQVFNVFFLLGESANLMDTAGPWEVFQDANLFSSPLSFRLHTIAATGSPLTMSGGFVTATHFAITDPHPTAHIVVVPAQKMALSCQDWLITQAKNGAVILSVCTGAFHLARAGLLDRLKAATHHQFWQQFSDEFPHITLIRDQRFIDNGQILCAGGLTSGIDAALYLLTRLAGPVTAQHTAEYLEHHSVAWQHAARQHTTNMKF